MDASEIATKAKLLIKNNKKKLCEQFASLKQYPPVKDPSAYFMAVHLAQGRRNIQNPLYNNYSKNLRNVKLYG